MRAPPGHLTRTPKAAARGAGVETVKRSTPVPSFCTRTTARAVVLSLVSAALTCWPALLPVDVVTAELPAGEADQHCPADGSWQASTASAASAGRGPRRRRPRSSVALRCGCRRRRWRRPSACGSPGLLVSTAPAVQVHRLDPPRSLHSPVYWHDRTDGVDGPVGRDGDGDLGGMAIRHVGLEGAVGEVLSATRRRPGPTAGSRPRSTSLATALVDEAHPTTMSAAGERLGRAGEDREARRARGCRCDAIASPPPRTRPATRPPRAERVVPRWARRVARDPRRAGWAPRAVVEDHDVAVVELGGGVLGARAARRQRRTRCRRSEVAGRPPSRQTTSPSSKPSGRAARS